MFGGVMCIVVTGSMFGQDPSDVLWANSQKMKVAVTTDRPSYLPGEIVTFTLTVSNPGPAIKVPLPVSPATGCVYPGRLVGDEYKYPLETRCQYIDPDEYPVTTMAQGERRERVLKSYEQFGPDYVLTGGAGPWPGSYIFVYRYGGNVGSAEYVVRPATLEAQTAVRFRDVIIDDFPGQRPREQVAQYIHMLAVRSEAESQICVAQSPFRSANGIFQDGKGNFDPVGVGALKCVAATRSPVVSLNAVADANENLTIKYGDAEGGQNTVHYPASYATRRACESPYCYPGPMPYKD